MVGRTVKLFLVEGSPTGILAAEIMNWTGHVLVAPRSQTPDALKRPEAARTGVYLLTGEDPEHPSRLRVYIGEGDSVVDRIKAHAKDSSKEFWTHAFIITSKDANLTKAHARYLESRIVEIAKAAGRAAVANGTEPAPKLLPESDVADMEFFLSQVQLVLPVLGLDVLRPKLSAAGTGSTLSAKQALEGLTLTLSSPKHGAEARAVENEGELTVLAGSVATAKTFIANSYSALRQSLIEDGSLVERTGQGLVFATDVNFDSPSAAAAVILNRNANGRVEWRLEGSGQTLKDWQDAQLAAVPGTDRLQDLIHSVPQ